MPEHELERERPLLAAPDEAVALGDPAQQREHEPDGELCRRAREHVRRVRDHEAAPGRLVEIDVVHADRVVRDDAELWPGAVEKLGVDVRRQQRDDPVGTLRRVVELEERSASARSTSTGSRPVTWTRGLLTQASYEATTRGRWPAE